MSKYTKLKYPWGNVAEFVNIQFEWHTPVNITFAGVVWYDVVYITARNIHTKSNFNMLVQRKYLE